MITTSRKAAVLTDYVLSVGLRLSLQLEEYFETEVRPIIEAATTHERFALQDRWQTIRFSRSGDRRYWEKGKITLGKERIVAMLLRRLRSFEFIAVGGTEILGEVGPPALIVPRRWESLILTWGSDTATDDLAIIRGIHIANVDRLGEPHRRELDKLLYSLSSQSLAQTMEGSKDGGRPPRQRQMVEAWIEARQASERGMPEKEEAARAQAIRHFAAEIAAGKISEETIRKTIKTFYSSDAWRERPLK
jgi:hypothetical protein